MSQVLVALAGGMLLAAAQIAAVLIWTYKDVWR